MALGLPVILFTATRSTSSHRAATATPTFTPGGTPSLAGQGTMATLAIKASPHVSWKRTARGGIVAVSVFALLVVALMVLRALGIGPAGSLLAVGQALGERQGARRRLRRAGRGLVARRDDRRGGADQPRRRAAAVHVMPTSAIVAALEQMQRPDTARVDLATAREIAQRTGAKAVVAGSVVPAGTGYIVTARLVAARDRRRARVVSRVGEGRGRPDPVGGPADARSSAERSASRSRRCATRRASIR